MPPKRAKKQEAKVKAEESLTEDTQPEETSNHDESTPKEEASADEANEEEHDAVAPDASNEKEDEDDSPAIDPNVAAQKELIANSTPTTDLEIALKAELTRQMQVNERLRSEIFKLQNFVSKRKQTYKRKRKDDEAPRKSLSAYNLFVRERFAKLAEENQEALKSGDTSKQLTRVPPAQKVAEAGRAWKALSKEEKAKYEEMAKPDKDRYEEQMASYQAPDKSNKKRNKTGYNLFFSAHVLRMKNSELGVPSERGSVARIVGDAWKKMSNEERDFYEREADKQNDMPDKEGDIPLPSHLPGIDRPLGEGGAPQAPHHGFGPPDREYMGAAPPVIHPPNGYYDSRYGPPPYGYDYYGYQPPPGQSPSARGPPPPHDPYAYGPPPPPDYRGYYKGDI